MHHQMSRIADSLSLKKSDRGLSPLIVLPILLLIWGWPLRSLAHGIVIESTPVQSVQLRATYESGEPMAEAQVTVYAPTDPETPWLQAIADEDGYFLFTPDPAIPGEWDVQIRQAGHGELVRVDVSEDGTMSELARSSNRFSGVSGSPIQKWITIVAVVWGLIGTSLFFARKSAVHQTNDVSPSTSPTLNK